MDASRSPLVRSSRALRTGATTMTLLSLTGMGAFAATHPQNAAAPLKPAAPAAASARTAAPAATPGRVRRGSTVTGRVPTTTQQPRTRTHSS